MSSFCWCSFIPTPTPPRHPLLSLPTCYIWTLSPVPQPYSPSVCIFFYSYHPARGRRLLVHSNTNPNACLTYRRCFLHIKRLPLAKVTRINSIIMRAFGPGRFSGCRSFWFAVTDIFLCFFFILSFLFLLLFCFFFILLNSFFYIFFFFFSFFLRSFFLFKISIYPLDFFFSLKALFQSNVFAFCLLCYFNLTTSFFRLLEKKKSFFFTFSFLSIYLLNLFLSQKNYSFLSLSLSISLIVSLSLF